MVTVEKGFIIWKRELYKIKEAVEYRFLSRNRDSNPGPIHYE